MTAPIGRREQVATRIVFLVSGVAMSAWAPLVPFAQQRAGIGAGALGVLLLWLGIGSITTMALAGSLAAKFGCRNVIIVSAVPLCLALPVLAVVSTPLELALGLLVLGAGLGTIDVVMNIHAVIVERASGRAMMSGFHGLFSLGGIVGAGCVTAALVAGLSPLQATLLLVLAIIVAVAAAAPWLLTDRSEGGGAPLALPRGIVLFIGSLCFVAFLAEGAMLDWSAIYLSSIHGVATANAGIGYAAFSLAMTVGRLTGDRIVERIGGRNVVVAGGLCAAAGFALATLAPYASTAVVGFALIGLGCANIVPVLYTTVGRQKEMPEHLAVAGVTTLGYAGILAGPAAIGFVAQASSLPVAFLLLMALQVGVAISGRFLRV